MKILIGIGIAVSLYVTMLKQVQTVNYPKTIGALLVVFVVIVEAYATDQLVWENWDKLLSTATVTLGSSVLFYESVTKWYEKYLKPSIQKILKK